ncbi:MAG: GAF domain-containing protein, partial [Magnetococcales bacterium]|nr:GAF domain-containing protein [Magnetococcales bacterium]
ARYGGSGRSLSEVGAALGPLLMQCVINRAPVTLRQPGHDYFRIRSGLGEASPEAVLIVPVAHGGRLFAVLEVASNRIPEEEERALLTDLQPIIAMSLDILLRAERTTELLTQTTEAEERSRLILEAVNQAILGMDRQGVITFVNRTALELLERTEAETIGHSIREWIHPPRPEDDNDPGEHYRRERILQTLEDGQPRSRTDALFWPRPDKILPVEYATTALEREGQVIGAVVIFHERSVHDRNSSP